jgi:hypothetical protein
MEIGLKFNSNTIKRMVSVVLTHLGESVPVYIEDCVHQLRLWNPTIPIYIILERCHESHCFWQTLVDNYGSHLVYTDTLTQTEAHREFQSGFSGDVRFRKGYWKHVQERFFFMEELMAKENLKDVFSMEYDILVYGSLSDLNTKLRSLAPKLRMVMDNEDRAHPGFLYIPTVSDISQFNTFLTSVSSTGMTDMEILRMYTRVFESQVSFFPVITEARNRSVRHRRSQVGNTSADPFFLSQDSDTLGALFDSAVVGQWVGGIDPRNTGGRKITNYVNEGALYSILEMPFTWENSKGLWRPLVDNVPQFTIHMHSKALKGFLSDRSTMPTDDYDVRAIMAQLQPN